MTSAFDALMPTDSPPEGACVRLERPEPGLAVLILDPPHRKLALLDLPLMRDLERAIDRLATDTGLVGLVITGREPTSFAAGADLDALARIEDRALALELARFGQRVYSKLAALPVRKVAAVGGPVPGGAYELCLACDRIVLADHKSTRIGLPETQLGILPGWGGSQRLPRRIGVPAALEAILSGRLFEPRRALKLGLVDRLTWPEYLRRVASEIAMRRMPCRVLERGMWTWLIDKNPIARRVIEKRVRAEVMAKTRGHYPAPLEVLPLIVRAPSTPIEQGLAHEAEALARLAVSPECKNLVTIFRLSEEAKKLGRMPDGSEPRALERAGVIGAGVMGAGIAALFAEKGLAVRLSDVDRAPLDKALHSHRANIAKSLARKRLLPHEANAAIDRMTTVTGLIGFKKCQIVVEAVAERIEVKRAVLGELARSLPANAILASNTSSLSIDAIAEGLPNPERVVGMHFFNPVAQMPLVEVVRGPRSSEAAVRATVKLALKLGKTPVITRDTAGFLVNRLLGPYLDESVRLFEAGVDPARIDETARAFGMPMGPLELLDEVGFDIAAHAAQSLEAAFGERMKSSSVLASLLAAGFKGKKSGAGFYVHTSSGAKPPGGSKPSSGGAKARVVNPELARFKPPPHSIKTDFSEQTILDYLFLSMVNEAALALDESVVATPRELDLATVFGMGFPPFRGGLLRWADTFGARDICSRLARIAAAPDVLARADGSARFKPCERLRKMAESGAKFHA